MVARVYQSHSGRSQFEYRAEPFLTHLQGPFRRLKLPDVLTNEQIKQRSGQENEEEPLRHGDARYDCRVMDKESEEGFRQEYPQTAKQGVDGHDT